MQVKFFPDTGHVEQDINEWLINQPLIEVKNIVRTPMFDRYPDGFMCNQWTDTIVIFEEYVPFTKSPVNVGLKCNNCVVSKNRQVMVCAECMELDFNGGKK